MGFEKPNEDGERKKEKVTLVATEAPEGMTVHTELGISENDMGPTLREYQRKEMGDIKNLRPVRASEVGLEWRDSGGQKLKESDKWANESYVWVSEKK